MVLRVTRPMMTLYAIGMSMTRKFVPIDRELPLSPTQTDSFLVPNE